MAETPKNKKWTLMFYMASDNPLVISVVSQLKALKAAGYHPDVNVIAQFDPYAEGTPTHIFDVNVIYKSKNKPTGPNIGFAADPTVRNLLEDKLWRYETDRNGDRLIREALKAAMKKKDVTYNPPIAPELNGSAGPPDKRRYEPDPYTCLHTFLDFCAEKYPAEHYMLFILGHGVVVGNDIFLYDQHAEKNSITLTEMGDALNDFKEKIEEHNGTFELLSFNSCSVSSLEVAYELRDTANYMLASQGPTFVGSWPYREILMKIFQDNTDIKKLPSEIFDYCVQNNSDFLLAGYSYQLTLCDLTKVKDLNEQIGQLSKALVAGLRDDPASMEVILHAHWRAQSFFQEMYTDLYDFCNCILEHPAVNPPATNSADPDSSPPRPPLTQQLQDIESACRNLKEKLEKPSGKDQRGIGAALIDAADFVGPAYQYSHGLSVYFPWTEPSEDSHILQQYKNYKFSEDFPNHSWLDFLKVYFKETQRHSRKDEEPKTEEARALKTPDEQELQALQEDMASLIYKGEGPLGGQALNKTDPKDRTGGECECPSIKNYPRDTRSRKERRSQAQPVSVGEAPPSFAP